MASKKRHYAVKSGRDPLTGTDIHDVILDSWAEAYPLVHGAPGAAYAGFATRTQAEDWLAGRQENPMSGMGMQETLMVGTDRQETPMSGTGVLETSKMVSEPSHGKGRKIKKVKESGIMKTGKAEPDDMSDCLPGTLCCYVDGSFNDSIPNYSFGLVCVCNGTIVHSAGGTGKNAEATSMRQIAGELLGAMQALVYARKQGYAQVVILHDYKGVSMHAEGTWKRTNPFSIVYYDWMQAFFSDNPGMSVRFRKVDAHAGNRNNELADVLAKTAIGMTPDPAYLKLARELGLLAAPDVDARET